MSWCYDDHLLPWFEVKAEFDPDVKISGQKEDESVACFKISTLGPLRCVNTGFGPDEEREKTIFKTLNYRDTLFRESWNSFDDRIIAGHRLYITISGFTAESCYVNNSDVPEGSMILDHLNTDARYDSGRAENDHIRTDSSSRSDSGAHKQAGNFVKAGYYLLKWKDVMDALFKEEVFVRRQQAVLGQIHHGSKVDFKALISSAKEAITSQSLCLSSQAGLCEPLEGIISDDDILYKARDKFHRRVTDAYNANQVEEDCLYTIAYIHRLRKSFRTKSSALIPRTLMPSAYVYGDKLRFEMHAKLLRDARLRVVLRLAKKIWDDEFRSVKMKCSDDESENLESTESEESDSTESDEE
jgi:hypothetical protein